MAIEYLLYDNTKVEVYIGTGIEMKANNYLASNLLLVCVDREMFLLNLATMHLAGMNSFVATTPYYTACDVNYLHFLICEFFV